LNPHIDPSQWPHIKLEAKMTSPPETEDETVPYMQRLFDQPFVLLAAGMIVMFVFYTGWGMVEILGLPASKLP
jgi:hypothetical protein